MFVKYNIEANKWIKRERIRLGMIQDIKEKRHKRR